VVRFDGREQIAERWAAHLIAPYLDEDGIEFVDDIEAAKWMKLVSNAATRVTSATSACPSRQTGSLRRAS